MFDTTRIVFLATAGSLVYASQGIELNGFAYDVEHILDRGVKNRQAIH